jgi:hypothetical protein
LAPPGISAPIPHLPGITCHLEPLMKPPTLLAALIAAMLGGLALIFFVM